MRSPGTLRLAPAVLILAAAASAAFLVAHAPTVRAACGPSASQSPCPTPVPVNAFLSLDVTAGGPNTVINVTGGQFLPNQTVTLYWDQPSKVAGSATADANGNFNSRVKPFGSDAPGVHKLCASINVQPNPCANFALDSGIPSPTPTPSPPESPLPSASPDETPGQVATPVRITSNLSGLDVISRPPFVFLPIFGIGAILLSLAYWAFSVIRRPRRLSPLPSAAIVHRATRPDYSAGFGAAPAAPAAPSPAEQPSAWSEPMHAAPPAAPLQPPSPPEPSSAAAEPQVEWGPPSEWGTGSGGWGFEEPPEKKESSGAPPPSH